MKEQLNKQQRKNKPHRKKRLVNWKRILIIGIFVAYAIISIVTAKRSADTTSSDITIKQFYDMVKADEVEEISINRADDTCTVRDKDNNSYIFAIVHYQNLAEVIEKSNIKVATHEKDEVDAVIGVLATLPMTVIVAMLAVYMCSTVMGASTRMFTLIKNKSNTTTFDDIKGMDRTKQEVKFIISQMRHWKELGNLGARPCKGMLLFGPPGVGKTMLAKAIAKESGVGFISCSGSDFDEVFVGVGAGRVRSLFDLAEANTPCVIFIDEIDCLGRRRRGGDGASQDHNQTLNALLQRMDGLNDANGILVIGATNRKEDLDPAVMRPGRFDRHFYVGTPDTKKDRDELVEIYLNNKQLADGVTLENVSKLMVGLSGAEVEEALNSAVFLSLQDDRDGTITIGDIDEAIMQLHTDGVKKEHSSKRDEEITSVHESGHALVSLLLGLKISKVSNIPYSSGVGGITMRDLDETGEQKFKFKREYEDDIKVLLAGKCAEEAMYGEHTQGCSNDLEKATQLIYEMISAYGFDSKHMFNETTLISMGITKDISEITKEKCNILLHKYNEEVLRMIRDNRDKLITLQNKLIAEKTIVCPTLDMISDQPTNMK